MKLGPIFEEILYGDVIGSDKITHWFADSEMVSSGKPMIFYHGSNNKFDGFDKNTIGSGTDAGWLGWGFYFYTSLHEAEQYGKVSAYCLRITNPYFATHEDNERLAELNNVEASKAFTKQLVGQGYDGVYYDGNLRGETVVFEPEQIFKVSQR